MLPAVISILQDFNNNKPKFNYLDLNGMNKPYSRAK